MKNQVFHTQNSRNSGNAIIISLIIIVLLGFLTAMLMRSSAKTVDNFDVEQANIAGSKLMRMAQTYETAVGKIMAQNGCAENDLNFDNTITSVDFSHTPAPTTTNCDIFNVNGAGLKYSAVPRELLDDTKDGNADFGEFYFSGMQCISGVANGDETTACTDGNVDLVLFVKYLRLTACKEINRINMIDDESTADKIPAAGLDVTTPFDGNFSAGAPVKIGDATTGSSLFRHPTGCFKDTSGTAGYTFYHVLLRR